QAQLAQTAPPLLTAAGFGGATAAVSPVGAASVQVQAGITVTSESFLLSGPGFNNNGALENSGGNNTIDNPLISPAPTPPPVNIITCGPAATIGLDNAGDTLTLNVPLVENGSAYGLNKVRAGDGYTKVGPGTLVLGGGAGTSNTFTGPTAVAGGGL